MEALGSVPIWEPPAMAQSSLWEEMLCDLLEDPDAPVVAADNSEDRISLDDEVLLGFLVDGWVDADQCLVSGQSHATIGEGNWWSSSVAATVPADALLNDVELPDVSDACLLQETLSLPGLSSDVSCLHESPPTDSGNISGNNRETSHDHGVSSPGSCSLSHETSRPPLSQSEGEGEAMGSHPNSPIGSGCRQLKAPSPDTGSDSSDVGAMGRSCDNFANQSEKRVDSTSGAADEDAKRQSRLQRNRVSATQSRLRKKSYVTELEAKCRMMESQLSMLQQSMAFTSAQNAALREELANVKGLKGNGSKSGAVEPAALPSDSLPSESPSRHTSPCLSVSWLLVAFLYHVLLRMLLQALPLKLAISGESVPSKAWRDRRVVTVPTRWITRFAEAAGRPTSRLCSANRRRKRTLCSIKDMWLAIFRSLMSPSKLGQNGDQRILHIVDDSWIYLHKSWMIILKRVTPLLGISFLRSGDISGY